MGRLTTHVLDTARGRPGSGIQVKLFSLDGGRHLVANAVTNADGRTDLPLLNDETFRAGIYELEFGIGSFFAGSGMEQGDPPFLGDVVIRCALAPDQNYHVPLLVSPWSYATYRGS
ncbi:MAG: hydroxyisourate hydrolase [Gammaproteobacteria bacterium]|nr:hydroxyisourate hydrolase [Gammaproteobacteria bacterium]MDH4314034.1 hydroxyisourate hydrolase [Gammaproteobacteria bacterium]MDH5213526.1 hydroxyisourate hydrolase [Gammaproteobacteria bacterium]MDH5501408.1 hydroxyisourate hydrolase [Gammaproteobacteria bacterium]